MAATHNPLNSAQPDPSDGKLISSAQSSLINEGRGKGFNLADNIVALPLNIDRRQAPAQDTAKASYINGRQSIAQAAAMHSARLSGNGKAIARLEQIEKHIRLKNSNIRHPQWLEEYIDLGLEMAQLASQRQLRPLQESWLKRIYTTLRDTAFDSSYAENWRQQCGERLYQPFFALQHFYRDPACQNPTLAKQRMRLLFNDLSMLSRYVV